MSQPRTFPEAFQRTVAVRPDAPALRSAEGGEELTWRDYAAEVERISSGLASLGLRRGDTFMAMLTNRPEFNLTEVAASHLGAATYSIYNTSSPEQIGYAISHAQTRIAVCERQFASRIRESGAPLDHLLIVEDGDLEQLRPARGFDFGTTWRSVEPDDVLCLIYTSGTTGPPKCVEHTHRGWLRLTEAVGSIWPLGPDDTAISYLPSSHSGDRFFRHYYALARGAQVITLADPSRLVPTLAEVHPTTFAAVPRTWEKLKAEVERRLALDPDLAAAHEAGEATALAAIREQMGLDRVRWALTGTAAIPRHVYAFWHRLGVQVAVGWGMTECGLGTGSPPAESRMGTIGRVVPGAEARVAGDGELLVRMPWMMRGYRGDPEATAQALDAEGWLHTGDLAEIDPDGTLTITGRKKEVIVGAGGKNMSPRNIEEAIARRSQLMGPVVAVGNDRPYNVALVTLDPDGAAAWARAAGVDPDPVVLARHPEVLSEIAASVAAGNRELSRIEQVKRHLVLPTFWTPGGDELTATSKLRRDAIEHKYRRELDQLYGPRVVGSTSSASSEKTRSGATTDGGTAQPSSARSHA